MNEEELKEELKNKMDVFLECYKNGMIYGQPTDIEFYEKIASLQQKVEQLENDLSDVVSENLNLLDKNSKLENIRKEAKEYINHAQNYGTMAQVMPHLKPYINGDDLLNILNKGSKKDVN